MHEMLVSHKEIPFAWVLWLPMLGLWAQAALSALDLKRGRRDKPSRPKANGRFNPARPPRLMAPR